MTTLKVVILFLFCLSFSNANGIPHECVKDTDCELSFFCYQSFCERCIPCEELLNRHAPISSSGQVLCARTEDGCGKCLSGYESEDLANHRRSMKCYPSEVQTSSSYTWLGLGLIVLVISLTVTLVIVYLKCRSSTIRLENKEEEDVEFNLLQSTEPPPYEAGDQANTFDEPDRSIGSVRESERIVFRVEQEHISRAEPIHYHQDDINQGPETDEMTIQPTDDGDGMNNPLQPTDNEEVNDEESIGSNETIPSLWEPTPSIANSSLNIVRSLSLETIPLRDSNIVRMPSDPGLLNRRRSSSGCENYCHRHVRLSLYRSESQIITSSASSPSVNQSRLLDDRKTSLKDQSDDICEPEMPEPFSIQSSSNGDINSESPNVQDGNSYQSRGIRTNSLLLPDCSSGQDTPDSGFHHGHSLRRPGQNVPLLPDYSSGQDTPDSGFHQERSRRRPGTTEELYEVRLALSFKRRRRNCSENE